MTDATPEQLALARKIAAEILHTREEDCTWLNEHETTRSALRAIIETTELAAKMAETISSIHVERRDDALHEGNHMGALTQARNAQTADHVADALRTFTHLKGQS